MSAAFADDLSRHIPSPARWTMPAALRLVAANPGLQALAAYRLGRWLLASPRAWLIWPLAWPLYFAMSRYVRIVFDIRLELSADIGHGLYIAHFGGILVRRCRMGSSCSIAQSVRLAPAAQGEGPMVEDQVWIGAHARLIGPYRIGAGCTIAAGAVVTRDLPGGALCMGDPARIVRPGYYNGDLLGLHVTAR